MAYVVTLENLNFNGPLDLLLQLIHNAKIDIKDIFLSDITDQFLGHISRMQQLDMYLTGEFIEMAALLIEIKSRALLPEIRTEEEESPEELLIRRLEEYKACKQHAEELKIKADENAGVVFRYPQDTVDGQRLDINFSFENLLEAFDELLKKAKQTRSYEDAEIEVRRDRFSVNWAINKISGILRERNKVKFSELFEAYNREEVIVTFVALLELWKESLIAITQKNTYSDIFIQARECLPE